MLIVNLGKSYAPCSVVVTSSHLVVLGDFVQWIFFSDAKKKVEIKSMAKINDLKNLVSGMHKVLVNKSPHRFYSQELYDNRPEQLQVKSDSSSFHLLLETEAGVQELIGALNSVWKRHNISEIEVMTYRHDVGGH